MLASVLKSQIAVRASIAVVRAFVRLREVLATHGDLADKIASLEKKYDSQFRVVFDAIRELMRPLPAELPPAKKIGFIAAGRN